MLLLALLSAAAASTATPVRAAPEQDAGAAASAAQARKHFVEGGKLFHKGEYEEALRRLERSYELQPSPNSSLLIGRTLARLGRHLDAYEQLMRTEREARDLVAAGESRYEKTARAAIDERMQIRARLAEVSVQARNAPPGTELEVDGERTPLAPDGTASFMHAPGGVTLVLHATGRPTVTRSLTLVAGRDMQVEIDLAEPPPPKPPKRPAPPPDRGDSVWIAPAVIAGSVTLVGAGLFAGFGANAMNIRSDLEDRCAPNCGAADEEDRTDGERSAAVANAGLVVGLVGLAATVTFTVLALTDDEDEQGGPEMSVGVAASHVGLTGRF